MVGVDTDQVRTTPTSLFSQRGFHFHKITSQQLISSRNEAPMLAEFSNFVSYQHRSASFYKEEINRHFKPKHYKNLQIELIIIF